MIDNQPPQQVIDELYDRGYDISEFEGRQWIKTDWNNFDTAAFPLWMAFTEQRSLVTVFHCEGRWIVKIYSDQYYNIFNIDDIGSNPAG